MRSIEHNAAEPNPEKAAVERLLRYSTRSDSIHLRIAPAAIGVDSIGHFAFFHSRFETRLWPIALGWLRTGQLAAATPGVIVSTHSAQH